MAVTLTSQERAIQRRLSFRPTGQGTPQWLSAAQPQPNDRSRTKAFVTESAVCRVAVTGGTSSPKAKMRLGSTTEQVRGKSPEQSADLQFLHEFSDIVLHRHFPVRFPSREI